MDTLLRLRVTALLCLSCVLVPNLSAGKDLPAVGETKVLSSELDGSIPEKFRLAVGLAQIYGRVLNQEDRAAWVASDLAVERKVFPEHPKANGWIAGQVDFSEDLWQVSFTEKTDDRQLSFFDVQVDLSGPKPTMLGRESKPARRLNDVEHFLAEYRDMLLRSDKWLRCSERYNYSLGLEIENGKKVFVVKLLPARSNAKLFPLGGFHEFRFKPEGERKEFNQTKTCVNVDTSEQEPVAFVISHLTSETPTQFHVFMSLSYGKPIYVATTQNDLSWVVDAGTIKLLEKHGSPAAN